MSMKLIGIGGTDGSGKDTLAEMVGQQPGWLFVSVTDMLRDEAQQRGIPLSRENLRKISSEWRKQHGLGVLVDKAVAVFKEQPAGQKLEGLVIVSLRNFGEADRVHELGGKVIWVDADPQIRYQRVINRNRGNEDRVTFQQFMAEETTQMHHSGDETTLDLSGVKDRADTTITNDTTSKQDFTKQVQKDLKSYL